jgi:hypothetical protein
MIFLIMLLFLFLLVVIQEEEEVKLKVVITSNQLKYIGTFSLYFTRQIYSLTMHYITHTHTHQSLSLYTWLRLVRSSHIHQKGKYILCQMSLQMAI